MSVPSTHPAVALWVRHHSFNNYPELVRRVPQPIAGTAFFPGGYGIWNATPQSLPPLPVGKIMVLGHNFDSEAGYAASREAGHERMEGPTWSNLLRLMDKVSVEREDCFFTNVYMGLIAGENPTGPFAGRHDSPFVAFCLSFLADQLRTLQPRTILTLGVYAPALIAKLSPQLVEWAESKGFADLDRVGPVQRDVRFNGVPGLTAKLVALIHPCYRLRNVWRRNYNGLAGDAAECAMLRDVL